MGRLYVKVTMGDDAGETRLLAIVDEPTRLDVDTDPLYVFGRLEALTARAVAQLHDQALQLLAAAERGRGVRS